MEKQQVAVVLMAKEPVPGRTKTRLRPALNGAEAAELSRMMFEDRCDQVRRLDGVVPAVAVAGWNQEVPVPALVPEGFEAIGQREPGLGAGLSTAAAHFLSRGIPVVLVDSDSPTLPLSHLEEALEVLRAAGPPDRPDTVIGPAADGGYYLLGLSRPAPRLFVDMPWSTSGVVPRTLDRAAELGLSVHLLPAWWDVDEPEDLRRLQQTLFDTWWPARTADWLRKHQPPAPPVDLSSVPAAADLWAAPWHYQSTRIVYQSRFLTFREDRVLTPDLRPTTYGVVDCGQCVGVLPFVDRDTVLLVGQYRYVADRVTWEMPTGGVDGDEDPEAAALRELAEEARVKPGRLEPLGAYNTSKSVMDETAHLYVAHDLSPATGHRDDEEFIEIRAFPFDDVLAMVRDGEIVDGMTIIAVLRVALERAESGQ